MAHPQQHEFVVMIGRTFPRFFVGGRVLEIGSLDVNGSVRQHFAANEYVGVDLGPGPGVDVACPGQDYDAPAGSFDVVISCETMEHNPFWRETFSNMLRLCRPGGLVIMTCATLGRPEHGTRRTTPNDAPLINWDYYQNRQAADFTRSFLLSEHLTSWMFVTDLSFCDLFFAGFKGGAPAPEHAAANLTGIRRHYLVKNLGNRDALVKHMLIKISGEQRYMSGSLLPWKRRRAAGIPRIGC